MLVAIADNFLTTPCSVRPRLTAAAVAGDMNHHPPEHEAEASALDITIIGGREVEEDVG